VGIAVAYVLLLAWAGYGAKCDFTTRRGPVPQCFRVTCPNSLDEPRYRFLTFRDGRLRHTPPPAIGESIDLPPVEPLVPFMP